MNHRLHALAASGNPVVQVFSLVAFGVVLIGAVLMGAVILSLLFGLLVIGAVAFSLRLWWLRRKAARSGAPEGRFAGRHEGRLIDAEYLVIKERRSSRSSRR